MTIRSMRGRLLASTMIVGAVAIAGMGHAQTVQTAPGASAQPAFGPQTPATLGNANGQSPASANAVETVTVTGSLIRRPGLSSSAPIATVSQQEFRLEGTTDAVEVLDQLPQQGTGGLNNTPNPLNGSGGFTEADLRNLGSVRTLVLQDGRRLMPGDPTLGGEAADLDTIPQQLVQRVDVLTGGSSTTYGSDAVAGVVNFIMKHDFQGLSFDIQYGADWHTNDATNIQYDAKTAGFPIVNGTKYDGQNFTASLAMGANAPDGRGNVEAYLNYRHQDPVYDNSRDFSSCETYSVGKHFICIGSSNSNYFQDNNAGKVYSVSGNSFVPFGSLSNSPSTYPTGTVFNSNGFETMSREDDRYQGGFFANYKILPQAELYTDFNFMDDRSQSEAAPSAVFRGPTYTLACDDPLLSAQEKATLVCQGGNYSLTIGRRDVEGGPRVYGFEHLSYRGVGGVRGDIAEGWHYDAYAQYGYTRYDASTQNDLSISHIQAALNDCPAGSPGACVPYNIFTNGGVTPAALSYIKELGTQSGDTEEQVVHAGITGQLGQYGLVSPFAHDGLNIALGTEYRREALVFQPDVVEQSGDLAGSGGASPAVSGNFDVYELFGELDVPIVQDRPFMKSIDFDTAYRFSDYSEAGITNTYKFGLQYAPDSNILFRGSFNRAVRAPNTNELFTPSTITNGTYADPCAYDPVVKKGATATLAQCALTGVTAAQYGNGGTTDQIFQCASNQCSISVGGNLGLKPEQADTVTFGGVFTPKFYPQYFRNLDISVDYFHIDLKNAISTVAPQTIINECIDGITSYCGLIHRNPQTGELLTQAIANGGYVENTGLNIGRLKTSGIDFDGNYRYNLADLGHGDLGRLSFNYSATYTMHFINIPAPGLGFYDCAGYYGTVCGVQPRFKSKFRISYTSPYKFTVSGQWRFTGPMRLDSNQPNPLLTSGSIDSRDGNIHSTGYFDLTATYQVRDGLVLRAGVNNIFDKDPPILAGASAVSTGLPNTFPSFDELGREIFVGLSADF